MRVFHRAVPGPVLWLLAIAIVLGGLAPIVPAIAGETGTPTEKPTDPMVEPTLVPVEPTGVPTETPVEPTAEPTETPVEPTAEPTQIPTEPTVEPTETPVELTAEPTEEPQTRQGFGIQSEVDLTGTITKVASNTSPVPGELVAFTITVSGTAPAGTMLRIDDFYEAPSITPISSSIQILSNVAADGGFELSNDGVLYNVDLPFIVVADGAYTVSYTVQIRVDADSPDGTTIGDLAVVGETNPQSDWLDSASVGLRVTFGTTPLTGEITMVPSNANPLPGENVTFTLTASGTAPAGTRFSILDLYEFTPLTYVSHSAGALSNVTAEAPIAVTDNGVDRHIVTLSFNVPASGAYSATISVQFQVKATTAASETIFASANLLYLGASSTPLASVRADITVTAPTPLTGTITKVPSNANPVPGELLTFTITASGTAPAGTVLSIIDRYGTNQATLADSSDPVMTNATGTIDVRVVPVSAAVFVDVDFTVEASGAYHVSYTVQMLVKTDAEIGQTVNASVVLTPGGEGLDSVTMNLPVTAPTPLTGGITMVPSNANPVPGETVTFTITASGTAPAGTVLSSLGIFELAPIEFIESGYGVVTNATVPNPIPKSESVVANTLEVAVSFTVPESGEYSVSFTVQLKVKDATPVGEMILASAILGLPGTGGVMLDSAYSNLTVVPNLTPPTVTKTASTPYPRADGPLTYTITVSGEAYGGTEFTVTDVLPDEVSLTDSTTTGSTNVSHIVIPPGEPATMAFRVAATGAFSVTFAIETTVHAPLVPGTEISNTACVDVTAGPQDTCATVVVETMSLRALIQMLIAILLSILGPIVP